MRPRRPLSVSICVLFALPAICLAASASAVQRADDGWPGFRGRTGAGLAAVSLDTEGLAPTVLWRQRIGIGYSGVSVADGRAITMFEDGDQYMVAFDADSGQELWRRRVGDSYPGRDGSWNGPISTPVITGNLVIGLETWGRLFALDTQDGEPVWAVHLEQDLGAPRPLYGFASSPLVVGDTLVIHGGAEAGSILGFDSETGELRWKVGTEQVDSPSPVLLNLAGRDTVVASGRERVFGIDADSGETLWEYEHGGVGARGPDSLVPVGIDEDRIFLAHDSDASSIVTLRPDGDRIVAEPAWSGRTIRNSYAVAVHHDGYIYAYSARILTCIDASTGERQWQSRAPGDGFLIVVDDTLLILTKDGSLHAARATPEGYQEIAGATIFDELTWTPPSFALGDVFARSQAEIVRIDLHGGAIAAAVADDVNYNVPRSLDPGEGPFGDFVRAVAEADDPDSLIDAFLAENPELPLIEGRDLVHFLYRGDDEVVAISGDHVGARQEAPMERIGETDLFYYTARIDPEARIAYNFVTGSGTIVDPRNPLHSETLVFDADREWNFGRPPHPISDLRMPEWTPPAHLREPAADTRGRLEALLLETEVFGSVEHTIYLPHGYADSDVRYPVVYYHGQTPRELSALPRSLDNLIADGMAPLIAVFAEGFVPPAPEYAAFWAERLVPAVDAGYRTIASSEGRVSVGAGLGSLQAFFTAFGYPGMVSGVAAQTFFFLDTDWDMLTPLLTSAEQQPMRIYLDWGAYGAQNPQEAWDIRTMSREYWRRFEERGYRPTGGEALDGEGWLSWRNRTDRVLRALLPDVFE